MPTVVPPPPDRVPGEGAGQVQATFAATLVDEWVRGGVTDAVVCPGSRSAPLALALAARTELRVHVRLDERSAAFYALGCALATGRPAIVCTTSGTAAAEIHPGVLEASYGRVPLIACTADRPPELHGVGAPQTVDQTALFGGAVRWFAEPGVPDLAARDTWRSLAARALVEATEGPLGPGPVHLNLAFREPLHAEPGPLPPPAPGGGPLSHLAVHSTPAPGSLDPLMGSWRGRRGVVVAGAGSGPAADVVGLCRRLGWPLLADPRSGCRVIDPHVVAAANVVLGAADLRAALRPEVVVVLGAPWAGWEMPVFLAEAARHGATVVAVDPHWRWADPDRAMGRVERADPAAWLAAAGAAWGDPSSDPSPPGWLARWQAAGAIAEEVIEAGLADDARGRGGALSEPAVARQLTRTLGPEVTVVASSSMPVRDLETYAPARDGGPRVLANRGVNGIDGVCSTARGLAAAGGGPVVGVVGDLAFLHDVSALVGLAGDPWGRSSCTLVVLDNRGGGIFSFLPYAPRVDPTRFEQIFGTPADAAVGSVAAGFGLEVAEVATADELGTAVGRLVGGPGLSVVRVALPDRQDNVALHRRIAARAAGEIRLSLSNIC